MRRSAAGCARDRRTLPYARFFQLASGLTDQFPRAGARFLDFTLGAPLANEPLAELLRRRARRTLARASRLDRLLVVADLNIGDAVVLQTAVQALRRLLPAAEIDYVVTRRAASLVAGNRDATEVIPGLAGAPAPLAADVELVRGLCSHRGYDAIFNFCPFLPVRSLAPRSSPVVDYGAFASTLFSRACRGGVTSHVAAQAYGFVTELLGAMLGTEPAGAPSLAISLSASALERAAAQLDHFAVPAGDPIVLYNPDASSRYTRLPATLQVQLLSALTDRACTVLLGSGHSSPGIERRLLAAVGREAQERLRVIPRTVPLDVYAALVDAADVFITADTGPLHVAAAAKVLASDAGAFRNRTAIVSVFGPTPARLYGYDSQQPGFLPAFQHATSRCHVAEPACRNVTCINKMAKACREVRCFEGLTTAQIIRTVDAVLPADGLDPALPARPDAVAPDPDSEVACPGARAPRPDARRSASLVSASSEPC